MNRRSVINANTDPSRSWGTRRSAAFPSLFERTARDLGLDVASKEDGKDPLTQISGHRDDQS